MLGLLVCCFALALRAGAGPPQLNDVQLRAHPTQLGTASAASAVVVGGGPSGLATAYVLAKRGFHVTILERRAEPNPYEPQRAYLYLVDGRGQAFTDAAGLTAELASPAISVSSLNYTVTRIMPEGDRVEAVPPILDPSSTRPSYWISRAAFLGLLLRNLPKDVDTLFGAELNDVVHTDDGAIEIVATVADGTEVRLRPSLLVGADGLSSIVRERCAAWADTADAFTPVVLPSPSSGLRYKMIRLPPSFRLDATDASVTAEPRKAYSIRPAARAPLGPTRLGLLPVADPRFPRTANVILPPEHPVWGLKSAEDVRSWLRATFPALPMDEIVDASEAAAFATGRPGAFPAPCYSPCQQLLLPRAGIVLVGDAIHSFPPDIGQGVNAALSDVMLLARALDDATAAAVPLPPRTPLMPLLTPSAAARLIERALPAYGKACAPEAEAVARIAQIGFPYQYPLTRERNPLARPLWFANFLLRTFVLAKLAPRIFAPAAIVLVQRPHLSYQAVWQTAQQTTRRLQAIATCVLAAVAWPWLRRALLGA